MSEFFLSKIIDPFLAFTLARGILDKMSSKLHSGDGYNRLNLHLILESSQILNGLVNYEKYLIVFIHRDINLREISLNEYLHHLF